MNVQIYQGERVLTLRTFRRPASPLAPISTKDAALWLRKSPDLGETLRIDFASKQALTTYYTEFKTHFKYLEAAGGVVADEAGNILTFFRRGSWDLPKGKIDEGESPETAALREITEETGLTQITLQNHLMDTYHIYFFKKKWWLKRTWWFRVLGTHQEDIVPQTEEDIEAIEWTTPEQVLDIQRPTYASIRAVLKAYLG